MGLTGLVQHLREQREEIVTRWLETVLTTAHSAPAGRGLDQVGLRDHVPLLLQQIEGAIAGEATPDVEDEAREHGTQRWGHGFLVDEIIGELSALRFVVLDYIEQYVAAHDGLSTVEVARVSKRVTDVIDRTARASASQFVMDTLAQRQEIEAKLEQRTKDLIEDDHRKDAFLALLAHELRNPLGAISNALYSLRNEQASEPTRQRALDTIERQLRLQGRLVDDLMDVSRITREQIGLRHEAVDLTHLARETAEDNQQVLKEAGLTLTLELAEHSVPVLGDPDRLAQVFGNLLINAIKFTDPGGQVWLGVGIEQDSRRAMVTVRDTGIGIEPSMLPRVFDPFAQAARSVGRSRGGLGLGLALVKGLVELHGGEVHVSSDGMGSGTEFTLLLPLHSS